MNGSLQESFFSCPCRGGSAFVPCWWLWLKFWGLLQSHSISPSAQGAQGPQSTSVLYLCICWGCLLTSHLPCPQARLLGTLAVSRGLGDHQLRVLDTNIHLKPFLLSVPQVRGQQPIPPSNCPKRHTMRVVGAGKGMLRDPQA